MIADGRGWMALLREFAGLGLNTPIGAAGAPGLAEGALSMVAADAFDRLFGGLDERRRASATSFACALARDLATLLAGDEGSRSAIAVEATRLVERFGLIAPSSWRSTSTGSAPRRRC